MALFHEDQIGLDCLMVLASWTITEAGADLGRAAVVEPRPDYLRQLLTQGEIESDRDPVAKYVTLKAYYEKAGGALRRDLLRRRQESLPARCGPPESWRTDKLQNRHADRGRRPNGSMSENRYAFDEYVKYGELRKTKRQPDAEEAAALEDLDGRIAALHAQMERRWPTKTATKTPSISSKAKPKAWRNNARRSTMPLECGRRTRWPRPVATSMSATTAPSR